MFYHDEKSVSTVALIISCFVSFLLGLGSLALYRDSDNKFYHLTCNESGKKFIDVTTKYAVFSSRGIVHYTDANGVDAEVSADCKIENLEITHTVSGNKVTTQQRMVSSKALTKAEQLKDNNSNYSDSGYPAWL